MAAEAQPDLTHAARNLGISFSSIDRMSSPSPRAPTSRLMPRGGGGGGGGCSRVHVKYDDQ